MNSSETEGNSAAALTAFVVLLKAALEPHLANETQRSAWRRVFENLPGNLAMGDRRRLVCTLHMRHEIKRQLLLRSCGQSAAWTPKPWISSNSSGGR